MGGTCSDRSHQSSLNCQKAFYLYNEIIHSNRSNVASTAHNSNKNTRHSAVAVPGITISLINNVRACESATHNAEMHMTNGNTSRSISAQRMTALLSAAGAAGSSTALSSTNNANTQVAAGITCFHTYIVSVPITSLVYNLLLLHHGNPRVRQSTRSPTRNITTRIITPATIQLDARCIEDLWRRGLLRSVDRLGQDETRFARCSVGMSSGVIGITPDPNGRYSCYSPLLRDMADACRFVNYRRSTVMLGMVWHYHGGAVHFLSAKARNAIMHTLVGNQSAARRKYVRPKYGEAARVSRIMLQETTPGKYILTAAGMESLRASLARVTGSDELPLIEEKQWFGRTRDKKKLLIASGQNLREFNDDVSNVITLWYKSGACKSYNYPAEDSASSTPPPTPPARPLRPPLRSSSSLSSSAASAFASSISSHMRPDVELDSEREEKEQSGPNLSVPSDDESPFEEVAVPRPSKFRYDPSVDSSDNDEDVNYVPPRSSSNYQEPTTASNNVSQHTVLTTSLTTPSSSSGPSTVVRPSVSSTPNQQHRPPQAPIRPFAFMPQNDPIRPVPDKFEGQQYVFDRPHGIVLVEVEQRPRLEFADVVPLMTVFTWLRILWVVLFTVWISVLVQIDVAILYYTLLSLATVQLAFTQDGGVKLLRAFGADASWVTAFQGRPKDIIPATGFVSLPVGAVQEVRTWLIGKELTEANYQLLQLRVAQYFVNVASKTYHNMAEEHEQVALHAFRESSLAIRGDPSKFPQSISRANFVDPYHKFRHVCVFLSGTFVSVAIRFPYFALPLISFVLCILLPLATISLMGVSQAMVKQFTGPVACAIDVERGEQTADDEPLLKRRSRTAEHRSIYVTVIMVVLLMLISAVSSVHGYDPEIVRMKFPPLKAAQFGVARATLTTRQLKMARRNPQQFCLGIGDDQYRPTFYAPNAHNEEIAFRCRHLKETPLVDPIAMTAFVNFYKENVKHVLPHCFKTKIEPLPFGAYLHGLNASTGVKKNYARVKLQLDELHIDEYSSLLHNQVHKWTKRSGFVKVENANYRAAHHVKIKAPRMIQSATPEFICLVGPSIASLQNHMKRDLNSQSNLCFTSSVSSVDAARLVTELPGHYVEDDVSSWDASCCVKLMEAEVWLARRLNLPKATVALMKGNINLRGATRNGWRFTCPGTRKSGDPYTSCFNSLLNIMLHLYAIHVTTGKDVLEIKRGIRMLVQGDDNLMKIPFSWPVIDFKNIMSQLGFEAKAVYRSSSHLVEYCSMRLIRVLGGYNFVPKLGRVLCKAAYFIDPPKADPLVLVRGTALSLYAATSFLPPFKTYFDKLLQLTSSVESRPIKRFEWQMNLVSSVQTPETLLDLNAIYGWSHEIQASFEKEIQQVALGCTSVGPVFRWFCQQDTNGGF
jgi:hypothetical protein